MIERMKKILDLYSGLGGASEAFLLSKRWDVMRIENNELLNQVPNTQMADVKELLNHLQNSQLPLDHRVDVVWSSPPCLEFSQAYSAPGPVAQRAGEDFTPDMSHLEATLEIIAILKPKYWIIENVVGAIKHFRDLLGEPRQIHGAIVLWGNYPMFEPDVFKTKAQKDKRHDPLRSNIRAKIPIEVSSALLEAIENQHSIFDFIES
tara:strand:+ start:369 stop:986 length:618 start_codon:yes stop_codon:yes gene_type:complete